MVLIDTGFTLIAFIAGFINYILFSLIFTSYLYTLPPEQDTQYLLRPNLLWINTLILFFVTYFFNKVTGDLEKKDTSKVKRNLLIIGGLTYLFLFGQIIFWFQLLKSGNYVSTNSYFANFYVFTALHGLHLFGGLFFFRSLSSGKILLYCNGKSFTKKLNRFNINNTLKKLQNSINEIL